MNQFGLRSNRGYDIIASIVSVSAGKGPLSDNVFSPLYMLLSFVSLILVVTMAGASTDRLRGRFHPISFVMRSVFNRTSIVDLFICRNRRCCLPHSRSPQCGLTLEYFKSSYISRHQTASLASSFSEFFHYSSTFVIVDHCYSLDDIWSPSIISRMLHKEVSVANLSEKGIETEFWISFKFCFLSFVNLPKKKKRRATVIRRIRLN